jgi:hypothetical protein
MEHTAHAFEQLALPVVPIDDTLRIEGKALIENL